MATRRKYINGVQNPYQDELDSGFPSGVWADCPLEAIRADPALGFIFYEDWTNWTGAVPTGTTLTNWTATAATSGTVIIPDSAGGYLDLEGGSTAAQGIQIQRNDEVFKCAVDKTLWFECEFAIHGTVTAEIFAGLSNTDTAILSGSANASTDHIGWQSVTDDGVLLFSAEKATAGATKASATLTAWAAPTRLGFKVSNATATTLKIEHWTNGAKQTTSHVNANVSVTELTPSFVCQGGGGSTPKMHLDWVRVVQLR